jgi:hypothetical protein
MSTRWKGNFINFSIELYFGICFVLHAGFESTKKSQQQGDDDKIEEMDMVSIKRRWGNGSTTRT